MSRFWILLPFLSGCIFFNTGEKSKVAKTPEELKNSRLSVPPTYDTHTFGPVSGYQPGQWATYKIVKGGETTTTTLAVLRRDGDKVWIEVIEEGEMRQVSARRVSPDGFVDIAYYREIPAKGPPSEIFCQPISQYTEATGPQLEVRNRDVKDEELQIGEKPVPVKAVKVDFEDFNGRVVSERTWWSKTVPPLYAGSAEGGLVRKVSSGLTVELVAFGDGAKPLIELPK